MAVLACSLHFYLKSKSEAEGSEGKLLTGMNLFSISNLYAWFLKTFSRTIEVNVQKILMKVLSPLEASQ